MTLDEIRNIEFSRGRGYRAEEVDDFIDECVATVEQLLREKEEFSEKMKVLADKVVEYRNDEDNIRGALLNAQRAGETTLRNAEAKAGDILEAAKRDAENIRQVALSQVDNEKQELERMQREVATFKAQMMALYKEHLELLNRLPEPEPEPTVEPAAEEAPVEDDVVIAPTDAETVVSDAPVADTKPLSRFSDLKFGNDYDIHDDEEDSDTTGKPARGFLKKRK